jgi:hypothetical protein
MSTQPEEYLAARRESCRLLNLNADDLTAHETIRADLLTVLRLWLDGSQSALLSGGSADPTKILAVADVLGRLVPEPEHRRRPDPREVLWQVIKERRDRLAAGEQGYDGLVRKVDRLQAELAAKDAELAALRAGAPPAPVEVAPPAPAAPAPDNVVRLSRPATERTTSVVSPSSPPPQYELVPADEPWRQFSHLYE